jgi:hypothetical protein
MAARLSALCAGRFLPPGRFLVLIFVRGWVDPRAIVQLEGLGKLKKSTSSGTRTGDLTACSLDVSRMQEYLCVYIYRFLAKQIHAEVGGYGSQSKLTVDREYLWNGHFWDLQVHQHFVCTRCPKRRINISNEPTLRLKSVKTNTVLMKGKS